MLRISHTVLLLVIGTTVNAQFNQFGYCAGRYGICDYLRPCCGGGLDPLVCIQSGYVSYCYLYSEYQAHLNQLKITTASRSKVCAGLYQNCDFVSCCDDPFYPKMCSGTTQGKFCFLKPPVNTQTTTAPGQVTTTKTGTSITPASATDPTVVTTPTTGTTPPTALTATTTATSTTATNSSTPTPQNTNSSNTVP